MALEKRIQRLETNRRGADGLQRFMGRDWDCLKTLEKKKLLSTPAPYSTEKKGFPIPAVKDSAGDTVWNFARTSGELTAAAAPAKAKLKSLGIDKFGRLDFFYETGQPKTGRIVLSSKTSLPGLLEGKNPDIVWELSGITVEAKTAAEAAAEGLAGGAGEYVTACGAGAAICPAGVTCARHTNRDGSEGGIVANTATVAATATVGKNAQVLNNARVLGNAKISGYARVSGDAEVSGHARVSGDAEVSGNARVFGNARVRADARVSGSARVHGDAQIDRGANVGNDAEVSGEAYIGDNAKVYGHARIYGNATVGESARVFDYAHVYGKANIFGNTWVFDRAHVYGAETALVFGDARIYGDAKVYNESAWGAVRVHGMAHVSGSKKVCSGHHTSGQVASQPSCP